MTNGPATGLDDSRRDAVARARTDHDAYLTELGSRGDAERPEANAPTVLTDTALPDDTRLEVLDWMAATLGGRGQHVPELLAVTGDASDSTAVRTAALDLLAAAAFSVVAFRAYREDYEALLRDLLDDPAPELRSAAAGTLAQAHDPVLQDRLARGLRDEQPLPVDRHYAIRLLAQDDHLDNLRWLRELYADGDEDSRLDAIRAMGSYPDARDDLEGILQDRSAAAVVRQQAASSLRYLAPERFETLAKEIAVDTSDDPDIRTAVLTTLRHLGTEDRVYGDDRFIERVRAVAGDESVPQLAGVARDLLSRRADR